MGPGDLAQVLTPLRQFWVDYTDENLLVGLAGADDAAVYRISDEQALIQTVDFFTPIVDDPRAYGAIAAANAMSDVYAMGGEVIRERDMKGGGTSRGRRCDEAPWSVMRRGSQLSGGRRRCKPA